MENKRIQNKQAKVELDNKVEVLPSFDSLSAFVTVKVVKTSKHLKEGDVYTIGKETAIVLLKNKLVQLA